MPTALIADGRDPYALSVRRCRFYVQVLAWIDSYRLEQKLASGVSPDSDVLLSLHAQTLNSAATRRRLARSYRRFVVESTRIPNPRGAPVPLARREILRSRDLVEELAEVLERCEPVDTRGLAQATLLIRDGSSPFYGPELVGALRPLLREAIDRLSAPPTIPIAG